MLKLLRLVLPRCSQDKVGREESHERMSFNKAEMCVQLPKHTYPQAAHRKRGYLQSTFTPIVPTKLEQVQNMLLLCNMRYIPYLSIPTLF